MGGVCARVRDKRNAYRILVGKPEGKRQFVGRWFKMGGSDKMELKERRWKMVSWINMARDRRKVWAVVNTGMNFGIINYGELVD